MYIEQFREAEGIDLDKTPISKNSARKWLACVSSFWGKLTECENRTRLRMVSEQHELRDF
jgi:hypothetical protein